MLSDTRLQEFSTHLAATAPDSAGILGFVAKGRRIARGADCNALSGSGNTALLQAVQFLAHLDVVRVLLAAGADPLVRCEDEDGVVHTALSAAKFKLEQNEGLGNFSAPEICARWAEIVALLSAASSNDENK